MRRRARASEYNAISASVLVACLAVLTPRYAWSAPFCMSDIELKYYLADYTLYSMGRMGGHCLGKHPDLAVQFLAQMAILNKNSQTLQQQTEDIAKRAFERAFPGEGTSKLYQQEEWDADQALKSMTFSKEDCTSIASTLEAIADDPAHFVWIFVDNESFRPARVKVQQCS